MKLSCLSSAKETWVNLLESENKFCIFSRWLLFSIMAVAIELPLSYFWIIKFLFFESDFKAANSSGV